HDLPTFLQQIDAEDQDKLNSAIEQAFSQGEEYEMELRSAALEQERRWYRMIAHPLVDEQGERSKLSGIIIDITYYKQSEEKIFKLNQQLVDAARKAGMADIATSVLHNIGNVLNSASVSIALAQEKFDGSVLEKFQVLIDLINAHHESLGDYLTNDEKGKLIPEYLMLIAAKLTEQDKAIKDEIANVDTHLQHIKEVVAMQQSLSKPAKFCEQVLLVDLIDAALKMSGCDERKKSITLEKDYKISPTMTTDRTKVIEILVNLFRNSQQAMKSNALQEVNVMNIVIDQDEVDKMVRITVSDNGSGISPEHKVKIFSCNFTTKPDGHGVGLHASANLAKELGGSLQLEESVPGEGATFSLLLPVNLKQAKEEAS
ncbi:MAG: hypothetical protein GY821_09030, partial [Gammaproteobacteria bacterium]|nr:hypothetical protein [Gammaproteobacteria bacterium]